MYNKDQPRVPKGNSNGGQWVRAEAFEAALEKYSSPSEYEIFHPVGRRFPGISKKEWALWYSAIADIKRGMWYPIFEEDYVIRVENKIFITSGTFEMPILVSVYKFNSVVEAEFYIERRLRK